MRMKSWRPTQQHILPHFRYVYKLDDRLIVKWLKKQIATTSTFCSILVLMAVHSLVNRSRILCETRTFFAQRKISLYILSFWYVFAFLPKMGRKKKPWSALDSRHGDFASDLRSMGVRARAHIWMWNRRKSALLYHSLRPLRDSLLRAKILNSVGLVRRKVVAFACAREFLIGWNDKRVIDGAGAIHRTTPHMKK